MSSSVCPSCKESATSGRVVEAIGATFHEACFVCGWCKKNLAQAKFFKYEGLPYCDACIDAAERGPVDIAAEFTYLSLSDKRHMLQKLTAILRAEEGAHKRALDSRIQEEERARASKILEAEAKKRAALEEELRRVKGEEERALQELREAEEKAAAATAAADTASAPAPQLALPNPQLAGLAMMSPGRRQSMGQLAMERDAHNPNIDDSPMVSFARPDKPKSLKPSYNRLEAFLGSSDEEEDDLTRRAREMAREEAEARDRARNPTLDRLAHMMSDSSDGDASPPAEPPSLQTPSTKGDSGPIPQIETSRNPTLGRLANMMRAGGTFAGKDAAAPKKKPYEASDELTLEERERRRLFGKLGSAADKTPVISRKGND